MVLRSSFMLMFVVISAMLCVAQEAPVRVDICELLRNPPQYNRQRVTVRARVHAAFEDFTLDTAGCGVNRYSGIRLMYGGDEGSQVASTVNDLERPKGMVIKVENIPIPLVKNAEFEEFKYKLYAKRPTFPDGTFCFLELCKFYEVTADLTGRFFSERMGDKESGWGAGYGHMGCCRLLAIEQVANVDAKRTPVPAGGKFEAHIDRAEFSGEAVAVVTNLLKGNSLDFHVADVSERQAIEFLQMNWKATEKPVPSTEPYRLIAPDLLTNFRVFFPDDESNDGSILVERTTYVAVEPPLTASTEVSCKEYRWEPKEKVGIPEFTNEMDAAEWGVSRLSEQLGFAPSKPKVSENCSSDQRITPGWCSWASNDGMAMFSGSIVRVRKRTPTHPARWRANWAEVTVCGANH